MKYQQLALFTWIILIQCFFNSLSVIAIIVCIDNQKQQLNENCINAAYLSGETGEKKHGIERESLSKEYSHSSAIQQATEAECIFFLNLLSSMVNLN